MISSLELARLCGVSQGTVDRALHGRAGIRATTRERILEVARQAGYRPNPAARELITGVSRTVGAVVPSVNNLFFMDVLQSLGRKLRARGLTFQVTPAETAEEFFAVLEEFAARRHRLVLAIPPEEGLEIAPEVTATFPVATLVSPCAGVRVSFLAPDDAEAGRVAVRYLHARGHRRIAHLSFARVAHAIAARERGYEEAMRERGLRPVVTRDSTPKTLRALLETERPTALFCHNDWLASQVMLALAEAGRRVPEDVSVLGVDHGPTLSALNPNLTTLAYPREAVEAAFLRLLEGKGKPGALKNARFEVIEKRSVGAPRLD